MVGKIQRVPVLPSPKNLAKLHLNPSRRGTYDGNAFTLTSSIDLAPQSDGSGNSLALKNPNPGSAMEVMAFTFQIVPDSEPSPGATTGYTNMVYGDSISVNITADGVPLTNDLIPIWLMSGVQPGHVARWADLGYVEYVVMLDIPMWLPPDAEIDISMAHSGVVNVSATVYVGVEARRVKTAKPSKRMMPYWASYVTSQIDFTTSGEFSSSENDLMNGSGAELDVRRLVGRVGMVGAPVTPPTDFISLGEESNIPPDASVNNYFIQMDDSEGFPLVQYPSAFGGVFNFTSRAWETKDKMAKGGYFNAYGTIRAGNFNPSGINPGFSTVLTQAGIGLVGYREA